MQELSGDPIFILTILHIDIRCSYLPLSIVTVVQLPQESAQFILCRSFVIKEQKLHLCFALRRQSFQNSHEGCDEVMSVGVWKENWFLPKVFEEIDVDIRTLFSIHIVVSVSLEVFC